MCHTTLYCLVEWNGMELIYNITLIPNKKNKPIKVGLCYFTSEVLAFSWKRCETYHPLCPFNIFQLVRRNILSVMGGLVLNCIVITDPPRASLQLMQTILRINTSFVNGNDYRKLTTGPIFPHRYLRLKPCSRHQHLIDWRIYIKVTDLENTDIQQLLKLDIKLTLESAQGIFLDQHYFFMISINTFTGLHIQKIFFLVNPKKQLYILLTPYLITAQTLYHCQFFYSRLM